MTTPINNMGGERQGGIVNLNDVPQGPAQKHSSDTLFQNFRGSPSSSTGLHQTSFGTQSGGSNASRCAQDLSTFSSPYPRPSSRSPRPSYVRLPSHDVGLSGMGGMGIGGGMSMGRMGMQHSLLGQMGLSGSTGISDAMRNAMTASPTSHGAVLPVDMPGQDGDVPLHVKRPYVKTPRMAQVDHDKRNQPAKFACPVPGCGNTFTRHIDLKGASVFVVVVLCRERALTSLRFLLFCSCVRLPCCLCVDSVRQSI